jgi:hypothetical protein
MPPSDIDIPIAAAAPIHPQSTTKAKRCTVSRNCSNGNKGNTENSLEQSSTLTAHDNRYDPNDFTSNRKSQIIYSDIFLPLNTA